MKTLETTGYVKRIQKDYSFAFKLQVVQEIESGQLTRTEACHKCVVHAKYTARVRYS